MIATRRSVTAREEDSQGCDVLLPASGLDELLRESDYVVQAVQWTPETDQMLGKAQFEVNSPARAATLGPLSTAVAAAAIMLRRPASTPQPSGQKVETSDLWPWRCDSGDEEQRGADQRRARGGGGPASPGRGESSSYCR